MDIQTKNRRVGWLLTAVTLGLVVYSFMVIRNRGRLPEPDNLSKAQKILRGL